MNETVSAESIGRRLDGLQNNVSGLNRRMVTLESNLIDRVGALGARMAGLEDRADQLVDRISALETSVNSLILLVERIAKRSGLDRRQRRYGVSAMAIRLFPCFQRRDGV
jgi:hypothetical protein